MPELDDDRGLSRNHAATPLVALGTLGSSCEHTSARILPLVASIILLYVIGARGLLLLALACLVSGVASFVLPSKQRDVMSSALMARIRTGQRRAAGFRGRIEEGAQAEDDD